MSNKSFDILTTKEKYIYFKQTTLLLNKTIESDVTLWLHPIVYAFEMFVQIIKIKCGYPFSRYASSKQ